MGLAAVVYTLVALFQKSMALLLLPFVTHVMEPDVYGLVSLVTVVGTVIGIALCSPVENAVFRWSARDNADSAGVICLCAIYGLIAVPVFGGVGFAILFTLEGQILGVDCSQWAIVVLSACFMAAGIYFGVPLLRARDNLVRFVICSGVSIVVNFSLKVWLVFDLRMGLQGWIVSELVASATLYLLVVVLARPRIVKVNRGIVTLLARYGLPLLPHRLAFWGLTSLSRPILALTATLHQLGIFSLAANCTAVAALLAGEINRAVLVEYGREKVSAPTSVTRNVASVQLAVAFLVPASLGFGVALFGPIIFAADYQEAYPAMAVLLIAQCAYALYLVPMNYLCQTLGDTRFSWLSSCSGAGTVLGLLLVIGDGTTALDAALVTSFGYVVMAVVAFETCRRCGMKVAWSHLVPRLTVCVLIFATLILSMCALSAEQRPASVAVSSLGLAILVCLGIYVYRAPMKWFAGAGQDSHAEEPDRREVSGLEEGRQSVG